MPQSASFRTGRPQVAELRSQIRELKKLLLDLLKIVLDLFSISPILGGTKWPCDGRTAPSCKNLPYPKTRYASFRLPVKASGFQPPVRLAIRHSQKRGGEKVCHLFPTSTTKLYFCAEKFIKNEMFAPIRTRKPHKLIWQKN